jgi:hypothetical protein
MIFEDWSGEELQSDKWEIFESPGPEGPWRFEEPGAEVDFGEKTLILRVNPFTRKAEASPFDDFKHLVLSKEPIAVPESGVLTLEVEFAVLCSNNDPFVLRDAMAGFFLCDMNGGMALGAVSNGTLAGALCMRMTLQSGATETESFAAIAEAWKRLTPGQRHKYTLQYERSTGKISFWLDRKLFYSARCAPMKMDQMHLGLALLTLERVGQPLHGQGAELQIGPIEVVPT